MPIDFDLLRRNIDEVMCPTAPHQELIDEGYAPEDEGPTLPAIVDAFTFTTVELPEPPQIIKGLAHQGTKMILGGGSKSYKTWMQTDLALSLSYGLPWLGHECVPGKVLYINLEIPDAFYQRRVLKICETRGIQQSEGRLDVWNLRGYAARYQSLLPMITHRIREVGYIAVFIDPIYKIYGNTDENSASEVAQLMNGVERVCVDTKAMVAFGAHYSKGNQSGKEAIDRISGSGTFARDPDSIINFTSHEDDGAFVVETILRNLPPVEPFVVRWKYPLMERDDDADPSRLKMQAGGRKKEHNPIDLLRFILTRTQENPVSVTEWADLSNVKRMTLSGYLDEMRANGWIMTIGEGKSARKAITQKGLSILGASTL